jgi:2-methylaconitate cis-trans-isomerase PrpF
MTPMIYTIPTVLMRGGSSKGLYFLASDLPWHNAERDRILLAAMGSPDVRQIDGMGGGDDQTSKVMIVGPSKRPGIDVEYLFAQVSVMRTLVAGSCAVTRPREMANGATPESMLPLVGVMSTRLRITDT